jgi:Kdo2-lipid IVA lauroyltransferase/acyltransferase
MPLPIEYQQLANRACEMAFFFFYGLLRMLPTSLFRKMANPFLYVFIRFAIPKKRVIRNLSAAFGRSYSAATKEGLARGVQEHFFRNLFDCFQQLADDQHAMKIIHIQGQENLESALSKGRGVIAFGAHIGNFVLLGTRLGVEGYRVHTLFRIPNDKRIQKLIATFLPRYQQSVISSLPRRSAVVKLLDALKRNEIVHVLGDNLKKGRIDARLFGQKVLAPRGPVSLALRSEAPLVPMYLVRHYSGRMNLIIEPEIELIRSGYLGEDIANNTRRVVLFLESLIRKYPDQWNWLTVRLNKHHPDQKPDSNVVESFDLGKNEPDKKKDGAGEEGRTPDLMLGKHTL